MGQVSAALDTGRQVQMTFESGTIIRDFLRWSQTASAGARAEGARALAWAYLRGDLDPRDREDARLTMTALLDDRSPLVRLALAEVLAHSAQAPHHIVTALANDQSDISVIVLAASPVLSDAELVDALALGDSQAQSAVARRLDISSAVAAALAEVGSAEACITLCSNHRADLTDPVLARLIERFGQEACLREAILARPHLDPGLRHDLVVATARALGRLVTERAWMTPDSASRLLRDTADQACVTIAAEAGTQCGPSAMGRLVAHLRRAGRLTPALVLRALLCDNLPFFEAAMSELSGIPLARVAGLVRGGKHFAFGALYAKAGLPAALLLVFQAAIESHTAVDAGQDRCGDRLKRDRIAHVLRACARQEQGELGKVTALLRRFDVEAAREDARLFARGVMRERRDAEPTGTSRVPATELVALRSAA